jgi:TetR/AcrR family transcriptional repressor of mexJK operon
MRAIMPENARVAVETEGRRPRGRPRSEDLKALEARLVLAARQCFIAKGYGATTMTEVAKAATVSKKTLYARFPTKAELFRAVLDEQIEDTGRALRPWGPRPKTLEAMLRAYAEHMLKQSLFSDILQLNRLMYAEAGRFPELGDAAWARGRLGVRQVAEHIGDYAVAEGVPCQNPEAAAEMFIDLLRGWYSSAMLRSRPVTPAEIKSWTRDVLRLFLASRSSW